MLPNYLYRDIKRFLVKDKNVLHVFTGREGYTDIGRIYSISATLCAAETFENQGFGDGGYNC